MLKKFICCLTAVTGVLAGCGGLVTPPADNASHMVQPPTVPSAPSQGHTLTVRPPQHIVIVIEENHSYGEIAGNTKAPYINALMKQGATFTNYHGVEHPSQPNYLDVFSGSNQGVTDDSCPHSFSAPNLASELEAAGLSFAGYSEDLPSIGYTGCSNGHFGLPLGATYARKHNPWVNFTNVSPSDDLPFSSFPKDFSRLPTVAFVIPNLQHDMHSGSIEAADTWLRKNIQPYVQWARSHNSLLVVTWDEDDESADNRVPTIFVGPMIRPGTYSERVNHFNLLRTIEDLYGLPLLGQSGHVAPIADVWR